MYKECIQLFEDVIRREMESAISSSSVILQPNAITFSIALKVCTESTAYRIGHWIINQLDDRSRRHISVQINLIDFYGKCGMMDSAEEILREIEEEENDKYCNEIS